MGNKKRPIKPSKGRSLGFFKKNIRSLAVVWTIVAGYGALDFYVSNLWYQRHKEANRYLQSVNEPEIKNQFSFDLAPGQFAYDALLLYKVHTTENKFQNGVQDLIQFLSQNPNTLENLTSLPYERNGVIERSGNSFNVVPRDNEKVLAIQYIDEILSDNFSRKNLLKEYMLKFPDIFMVGSDPRLNIDLLVSGLDMMEKHSQLKRVPEGLRGNLGIGQYDPNGNFRAIENPQQLNEIMTTYFRHVKESRLIMSSWTVADWELVKNRRLYSRFHTHPIDDKNYPPSDQDKANTHIMGPNLLFSQVENIIHVYAIQNGSSQEILTLNLPNKK